VPNAATFVPQWNTAQPAAGRLRADYGWASEDVSHIGIPTAEKVAAAAGSDVTTASLRERALLVIDVAANFAMAVEANTESRFGPMMHRSVEQARPELRS
jgi:hypothetical protein